MQPCTQGKATVTPMCLSLSTNAAIQPPFYIILNSPQELIDAAKQQLITNHARLQQLGSRCGVQLDVDSEGYAAFSHAISEWDASQV